MARQTPYNLHCEPFLPELMRPRKHAPVYVFFYITFETSKKSTKKPNQIVFVRQFEALRSLARSIWPQDDYPQRGMGCCRYGLLLKEVQDGLYDLQERDTLVKNTYEVQTERHIRTCSFSSMDQRTHLVSFLNSSKYVPTVDRWAATFPFISS